MLKPKTGTEGGRPQGWIGVDLDGTLARYDGWRPDGSIGPPVPTMLARVKQKLAEGWDVRIVTARVAPMGALASMEEALNDGGGDQHKPQAQRMMIEAWCREHVGQVLRVQCYKDCQMIELWDDRARQVIPNTGVFLDERAVILSHDDR